MFQALGSTPESMNQEDGCRNTELEESPELGRQAGMLTCGALNTEYNLPLFFLILLLY